jgi:hypothetical protein
MDLAWKIKLVDELIRENPESRICDYLEAVKEIECVEYKNSIEMPRKPITQDEKDRILFLAATMNVKDIRTAVRPDEPIAFSTIYQILRENGFNVRIERERRKAAEWEMEQRRLLELDQRAVEARLAMPAPQKKAKTEKPNATTCFVRAKGEYSNRSPFGIATEFHQQAS